MIVGLTNKVNPINPGVFALANNTYCHELESVIRVAVSYGYRLPTDFQLRCINAYIQDLKSAGIWERRDTVFLFGLNSLFTNYNNFSIVQAGHVSLLSPFTYIDLKNPSRIGQLIQTDNSPFFNRCGLQNNTSIAAAGYFVTNFYPGSANNKWLQNDANFTVYISSMGDQTSAPAGGQQIVGLTDTGTPRRVASFVARSTTDTTTGNLNRSNNGGEVTFVAAGVTEQAGKHSLDRTASNLTTYYKNGVSVATSAQASGTIPSTYPIALLTQWVDGVANAQYKRSPLGMFAGGGSLGATLEKLDYEIFTQFKNKIGYQ